MASVGDDGHYRAIRVSGTTGQSLTVTDFGVVTGLTSIRSLATGTNVVFNLTARADVDGRRASSENLASRWGGFRRTVFAGSMLPRSYLYALHDNGNLNRYLVTTPGGRPAMTRAGQDAGFGAVRAMTLIGRTPQCDAILANTTTGRLILIKIPTTTAMTASVTIIRACTWQNFDQLVTGNCYNPVTGSNVTTLIGTNSTTGEAYIYQMGFLTGAQTPIRGLGRLAGTWHYDILAGVVMLGAHPHGA